MLLTVISRRVGGGASQPYLTFTYDGNTQRVRKENHFTGATTLYFGEVYEVRNEEPIIHLFANTQRIASIHEDGRMRYYHGNHLHSASVITDGYGNTKEAIEYHPYGTYRLRTDLDPSFPNVNYTFTDQEEDDEAGLYNYKARLYDPLLGRFISADSMVPEPGSLQAYNRYSYCLNNPVVYTDPSGHGNFFEDLWDSITSSEGLTALAISTVFFTGAGLLIAGLQEGAFGGVCYQLSAVTQATINAGAGVLAGGIGAAVTGGDIAKSAFIGGISAGMAKFAGVNLFEPTGYAGESILANTHLNQLAARAAVGGLTGGIAAELYGGNFAEGFGQGAGTAIMGYLFNQAQNEAMRRLWMVFQGSAEATLGKRGRGVSATYAIRADESQLSIDKVKSKGLGLSVAVEGGFLYTKGMQEIAYTCAGTAGMWSLTIFFSRENIPLGSIMGPGAGFSWSCSSPTENYFTKSIESPIAGTPYP